VRGRSRSRPIPEILKEIEQLVANGFKEIVLTGINIGDFDGGVNGEKRLADLVKLVDKIPGVKRLRISSIDPDEVDEPLIEAILGGQNTCPSMHIVLQSGSNVILKRMNRKYTKQIFLDSIDKLVSLSPDFTFTTDVIVGFPQETEIDHQDTLQILRTVKFAKVHMFPYSDRPGTKAASMPGKVEQSIINRRKQEVLRLSEKLAYELRAQFVGRTMSVLLENKESSDMGMISGHTSNFLNVLLPSFDLEPNTIVDVKLIANTERGLIGERL
jgi:threonylcarbamoyladenosine tRNA methylthiotransferase MtaB